MINRITKLKNLSQNVKINIIYGASNRGKTTLIHYLVTYILINGGKILHKDETWYEGYPHNIDHCIVIEYKDKIYVFMAQGDYFEILRDQTKIINNFKGRKIGVLVGTSRTKGDTKEWWNKIANDYKYGVEFFENNQEFTTQKEQHQYHTEQFHKLKEKLDI